MTFEDALATGRRIRRPGHKHGWKTPTGYSTAIRQFVGIAHCDCQGTGSHTWGCTKESSLATDWVAEKSEDELDQMAKDILLGLGIEVRERESA